MAYSEISLQDAWALLEGRPDAALIDVRTLAEWNFVGIPDLSSLGKELRTVEWTRFPTGEQNPAFVEQATEGLQPDQPLLFLCRSGARSRAAAQLLEGHGFTDVRNVTAGFEGDLGPDGHRHGGWKDHLPWRQS